MTADISLAKTYEERLLVKISNRVDDLWGKLERIEELVKRTAPQPQKNAPAAGAEPRKAHAA